MNIWNSQKSFERQDEKAVDNIGPLNICKLSELSQG